MHRLLLNQWSKYLLYVFFCDTAATTLIQWLNSFLVIQTLKVFMKVQYARYCSNAAQFSSKIKLKTEMWYCQRAELYNFLTCHWWLMHDQKKKKVSYLLIPDGQLHALCCISLWSFRHQGDSPPANCFFKLLNIRATRTINSWWRIDWW